MRYKNSVRASVIALILVTATAVGWFGIYSPMVSELARIEQEIESKKSEIAAAQVIISENMTLRSTYGEALDEAIEAQRIFFPELTNIQTIDEVNKILSAGGFKSESGITVSKITSSALSITLSQAEESINYEVREHSFLNDAVVSEEAAVADESGVSRSEVFKMLENGEKQGDAKAEAMEFLRDALAKESIEIGRITVNFSLSLTYPEYLDFLNLIENHEKAISIQNARFRGDDVSHDAKEVYNFEIYLYVVKPVEEL